MNGGTIEGVLLSVRLVKATLFKIMEVQSSNRIDSIYLQVIYCDCL